MRNLISKKIPKTHRLVIDSCMLQSVELKRFLSSSETNFAVLPDFIWLELYKQKSVDLIVAAFSVIGEFPEQLILLKGGKEIAALDPRIPNMTSSMQHADMSQDIREMISILNNPSKNGPSIHPRLEKVWANAADARAGMIEGAEDILVSLPEMAKQMFSPHQFRIIRTNARYTPEMFSSIVGAADQIWEALSGCDANSTRWRADDSKARGYLYRYSLAIVIFLLWWIKKGSQPQTRLDRVSNDLVDLSFGVYGTYYDGLMTSDKKSDWMHQNICLALQAIGVNVPTLRHREGEA
jgi:hypothetical protein